jgi:hypothetical protein
MRELVWVSEFLNLSSHDVTGTAMTIAWIPVMVSLSRLYELRCVLSSAPRHGSQVFLGSFSQRTDQKSRYCEENLIDTQEQ